MPSLTCPDCGTRVAWSDSGCAGCGVTFNNLRCSACKYVGTPDRFQNQRCPKCKSDRLKIVPQLGDEVDEVGVEAFVEDAPLLDEIERSFSKTKSDKQTGGEPSSENKPDSKPPPKTEDADPRPVLKRRRWGKREEVEQTAASEQKLPEKKELAKPKHQRLRSLTLPRLTFEVSPNGRRILRWGAMAVPIGMVLVITLYLFAGGSGRRVRAPISQGMAAADPAAIEAQAMALYNAAVEYYRAARVEETVSTLQQVVALFPLTNGGTLARRALDRMDKGQAPFDKAPSPATPEPMASESPTVAEPNPAPPAKKKSFIGIRKDQPVSNVPSTEASDSSSAAIKAPGAPFQGSTLAKTNAAPRALPDGFVAVPEEGVDASGWPIEIICLRDQSHMMLVPAGEFVMGAEGSEPSARAAHRVRLKAFYIDRYEITLLQYKHFLEQRRLKNNPYRELSQAALAAAPTDQHPVVGLAWRDANAYAEWSGKTLPTEAQWEKAARGSDERKFPWGVGTAVWERPRQAKQLERVGSFAWDVSPFGCFDMAGNAWEWCADWYDPNYYQTSAADDPEGPKTAPPPVSFRDPEKVIRGGSPAWEVTWRGFSGIQEEPLHVGFRCALEIEKNAPRPVTGVVTEAPRQPQTQPATRIPPGGYKF